MNLKGLFRRNGEEERDAAGLSWGDYLHLWERFGFNGVQYMVPSGGITELTALQGMRNPIVAACITLRLMVFSEITFAYQSRLSGVYGDTFGSSTLQLLETPWANGSTGDLLARMEVDASLYGNSYWVQEIPGTLTRLDPCRTDVILADVVNRITGKAIGKQPVGFQVKADKTDEIVGIYLTDEVAHYAPVPDGACQFRGASWLQQLLPDIIADNDMTEFKHAYLANGATPNLVVAFDAKVSKDTGMAFKEKLESRHSGSGNAFKTLYLGAGADVKVVGSNFEGLMLNAVQAAGETRIAVAAHVPPSLLSLSEGMKGSALNSGNYAATRRAFSDGWARPSWRKVCAALQVLCPPPNYGPRLWYIDRDVPFLQEDVTDAAAIRSQDATTIRTLCDGGFDPDSVIKAVQNDDMSQLKHTGLLSVQLQPIEEASAEAAPLALPAAPPAPAALPVPAA